jgi:hypothetical protein
MIFLRLICRAPFRFSGYAGLLRAVVLIVDERVTYRSKAARRVFACLPQTPFRFVSRLNTAALIVCSRVREHQTFVGTMSCTKYQE